jgi:transcriptional regulator with XRE-family HTH domain
MTPARYIRERIFQFKTQAEFGRHLGYSQATISRFESGYPLTAEAQRRIRTLAAQLRVMWDNNLFFEIPEDCQSLPPSM